MSATTGPVQQRTTPQAHVLGGSRHTADTRANINALITDGEIPALKIATYAYTLTAGDVKDGEANITISAVVIGDIRLFDACLNFGLVSKVWDKEQMDTIQWLFLSTTTNVNVGLGIDIEEGNIINLIIGEV